VFRELTMNAAELVRQYTSSVRDLLTAVESHRADLDHLRQIGVVLADTASEARQKTLHDELAALNDAVVELMEILTQHITQLEMLNQRWTELTAQYNELETLLVEKREALSQTLLNTSLSPDQQYAAVKVRIILF